MRHQPLLCPGGGSTSPYVAKAVHFDGNTYLDIASLTATDNSLFSFVVWLRILSADYSGLQLFTVNGQTSYTSNAFVGGGSNITSVFDNLDDTSAFKTVVTSGPDDAWFCFIGTWDTDFDVGLKKVKVYLGNTDANASVVQDADPSFTLTNDGQEFTLAGDTFNGDSFIGDMADCRIMPGVSLFDGTFDIPLATRRLFIDGNGKPVDPAVATAALGTPCMLFSGDAATFATNQGSGGAFTVTGALTNAATHP
jgi:hypothetical protein